MCRVSTKFAYFSCKYLFCAICFAHFLRNQLKTGSIAQNVHFYAKHWPKNWQKLTKIDSFSTQSNQLKVYSNLTKIDQNWQFQHTIKSTKGLFSTQSNQLKVYSKMLYTQINYDSAAINLLLLVYKIFKLRYRN